MLTVLAQFTPQQLNVIFWAVWIVGVLISLLVLWLVIFTAVRAALRSHQFRVERESTPTKYRD